MKLFVIFLCGCVLCSSAAPPDAYAEAPPFGAPSIVFPIMTPRLSSGFGRRIHPIRRFSSSHQGVDLAAPLNSPVRAVTKGRVVFADRYKGYGKLVTIQHSDGYTSHYGHLNEIRVNPGDTVTAGQIIGGVGSTGASTGPHLHFEWRHHGMAYDPLLYFPDLTSPSQG